MSGPDNVLLTEYHNMKTHTCLAGETLFSKSLRWIYNMWHTKKRLIYATDCC